MMLSSPIIACQGGATPAAVYLRPSQRMAMQQTRPVNSDTLAPDQRHPHDPRLPHDPRDPRGLRSDAPLLAGWLSFTAQAAAGELTPMSVPGHKQRQDLTGAVVAGDVPLYGGVDSIKHADVPLSDAAAHGAGVPRLVARAWAAHPGSHPGLPEHAIQAGADAMVTSAHKALPAYTQGAIVLARTDRLQPARLNRAFEATHTTSPAGSITASIDAARALLARDGRDLCGRLLRCVAAAKRQLAQVPGVGVLDGPGVEPTKLVVLVAGTGAHGYAVEADLVAAGMPVESADRGTGIPIVTIADDEEQVGAFLDVLIASIEAHRSAPRTPVTAASWTVVPETVLSPREAFFADNETVPATAAAGRISAELIAPYPPGVPVLAPGELITAAAIESLRQGQADRGRVAYAADPSLETFQVIVR